MSERLWVVTVHTHAHHLWAQVVVSHDRTFLNEVCTDVCHLNRQKLEYYQVR
jgi:ATPase subunit of ABC transporter with duplicated ATPase domains